MFYYRQSAAIINIPYERCMLSPSFLPSAFTFYYMCIYIYVYIFYIYVYIYIRIYTCRVFVVFFFILFFLFFFFFFFYFFLRQIHECLIGLPIVINESLCELYLCHLNGSRGGLDFFVCVLRVELNLCIFCGIFFSIYTIFLLKIFFIFDV